MQNKKNFYVLIFSILFFSFLVKAEAPASCKLKRELIEKNGKTFYVVGQRARTLYMISRDLYGDEKYWNELALNNQLKSPYLLQTGQMLLISTPPRLDEEKSNVVLIQSWEKLNKPSMVKRLTQYNSEFTRCNPKKIAIDFTAPVESKVEPLENPLIQPAPRVDEIVAATEITEPEEHHEEAEKHNAWAYSAALTASSFRLSSTEIENDVNHTLKSKINPGLQLALHDEKTEKLAFALGFGVEQIQFETPDDGTILDKDQLALLNFNLEAEYQWTSIFEVYGGILYVQRPFYRVTTTGATIDPVYLPEIFLGDHLRLFEKGSSQLSLVTEISYSFPMKDSYHDVKSGYGYIAGLKFEYKVNHSKISFSPAYRFLKEDTETAKEQQEALIASLGFEW